MDCVGGAWSLEWLLLLVGRRGHVSLLEGPLQPLQGFLLFLGGRWRSVVPDPVVNGTLVLLHKVIDIGRALHKMLDVGGALVFSDGRVCSVFGYGRCCQSLPCFGCLSLLKVLPPSMAVRATSLFSRVLFSFSKASSNSLGVCPLSVSSLSLVVGSATLSSTLFLISVARLDGCCSWPLPGPWSTLSSVPSPCSLSCSCCYWFLLPLWLFCSLAALSCPLFCTFWSRSQSCFFGAVGGPEAVGALQEAPTNFVFLPLLPGVVFIESAHWADSI